VNTGVIMAVVIRAVAHAHITNIVDPFIVLVSLLVLVMFPQLPTGVNGQQ